MYHAFKIAYDGRLFRGSARQPTERTVEGAILDALRAMGAVDQAGERSFMFSSRTDRGVSSLGNVFSVDTILDGEAVVRAMNGSMFQEGIWFLAWTRVQPDFRPRHAISRWYRYAYPIPPGLEPGQFLIDDDGMRQAADLFVGEHDFRQFSKLDRSHPDKSTVRTIDSIDITTMTLHLTSNVVSGSPRERVPFDPPLFQDLLLIDVRGQSFLWQMIRRISAAIVAVANKEVKVSTVKDILDGGDSMDLGVLPPENLVLMDVDHGLGWETIEDIGPVFDRVQRDRTWPQMNRGMFYAQLISRLFSQAL